MSYSLSGFCQNADKGIDACKALLRTVKTWKNAGIIADSTCLSFLDLLTKAETRRLLKEKRQELNVNSEQLAIEIAEMEELIRENSSLQGKTKEERAYYCKVTGEQLKEHLRQYGLSALRIVGQKSE
ncbi:MAG TPA: hypothetical protein VEL47_01255 [Myxococcota bacterium]|nr:hypothetical protein [Myxococcota bacterium]